MFWPFRKFQRKPTPEAILLRFASIEGYLGAYMKVIGHLTAVLNEKQRKALMELLKGTVGKPPTGQPEWLEGEYRERFNNAASGALIDFIEMAEEQSRSQSK